MKFRITKVSKEAIIEEAESIQEAVTNGLDRLMYGYVDNETIDFLVEQIDK